MTKITFDETALENVLEAFNKTINEEGVIVEKDSGEPVLDFKNGRKIHKEELGFIGEIDGKIVFVKQDLPSIIDYVELKEDTGGQDNG